MACLYRKGSVAAAVLAAFASSAGALAQAPVGEEPSGEGALPSVVIPSRKTTRPVGVASPPVTSAVRVAVSGPVTSWVSTEILKVLLLPLQGFLMGTPWFVMLGGLTLIAYLISGLRPAVTAFLMLAGIGFLGVWTLAMDTFSQVLVATMLAVLFGVVFGIVAAESNAFSKALRPVNDVLQTLPQLVYIIPFIYLMPVSIVPGIIAGVLYAFPVVSRLVERGVRDVAPEAVEAAGAFGATRRQILVKVKVPLAGDAIMLGVNQGIVMVLAVVVIGGLVGSGGLGYEVAQGLVRGQFGQGVIASLAILALGIALDRVTQGTRRVRKDSIG